MKMMAFIFEGCKSGRLEQEPYKNVGENAIFCYSIAS